MKAFILLFLLLFISALPALAEEVSTEKEKPKRLDLSVTAGGSRNTGSTDISKARLSLDLTYRGDSVTSDFKSVYQYEEKSGQTDQNRFELKIKELLKNKTAWSPFVTDNLTLDEIKGVDYDNSIGAGVKYSFYSKDGNEISLSGSALYQVLKYKEKPQAESAVFAIEPLLKWSHKELKFSAGLYYQASADDSKNYKFNSDFKLTYFLTSILGISAEFSSRYRNITPEDAPQLDTTTVFSVTLAY